MDILTQDEFKDLVTASQNPSSVVIWEVKAKNDEGSRTVGKGTDPAGNGTDPETVMTSHFASIPAATAPTRLVSLQTIEYVLGPWNPFPLLNDGFQASGYESICLQLQLCSGCCS